MVAFRLLAEAALIIAVAVIAGVAHLRPVVIVALMAGAFVLVALTEWLAARARFVSPASGFFTHELLEPAPYVETPAPAWGAGAVDDEDEPPPGEPDEDTEPEALTVVGKDPWEQHEEPEDEESEPAAHGFLRRLRR
jgi:hypothetical protein